MTVTINSSLLMFESHTLLCLTLQRHDYKINYSLKVHFCTSKYTVLYSHTKNSLYADVLLSTEKPDKEKESTALTADKQI